MAQLKLIFALILICPLLIGCGDRVPTTYPISGTVTLDGDPVEGAAIKLQPVAGGSYGFGVTDSDGQFEITTYQKGDGALPGEHGIVVVLQEVEGSGSGEAANVDTAPAEQDGFEDDSELAVAAKRIIYIVPERYSKIETSGLTVEVEPENAPLKLQLTSKSD